MTRGSKYTPERATMVIEGVRNGLTYRLAGLKAGIGDDTITNWKKRHSDFSERLMAAEADAAEAHLGKIAKASDDDWRAAAWILEHRHPHDYGKSVQEQQITGKDGEPLQFAGMLMPLPTEVDDS